MGSLSHPLSSRDLPAELLLAIFKHLDGSTLVRCSVVCRRWWKVICYYDDVIWSTCALRDFQKMGEHRFWSLRFPHPRIHNAIGQCKENMSGMPADSLHKSKRLMRTWQDMYRISRNWFTGNCHGYFPNILDPCQTVHPDLFPYVVIGSPQEHTFLTTLTVTATGEIVRSNPTYQSSSTGSPLIHQSPSLLLQNPRTGEARQLTQSPLPPDEQERHRVHTIFCHYTQPSSKWLVSGGLDGSVALWDIPERRVAHVWHGHRGRVLCVSMNNQVVVSGGSDGMIRVWDLEDVASADSEKPIHTGRRGTINVSAYLSTRNDWYQGVGEISVNGHLVACAPDASGPILIFSLLTGSLVYELRSTPINMHGDWGAEETAGFTKLCLTPYFLLTKGKLPTGQDSIPVYPKTQIHTAPIPPSDCENLSSSQEHTRRQYGYISRLDENEIHHAPPAAQMSPYQLYRYYQSINGSSTTTVTAATVSRDRTQYHTAGQYPVTTVRSCINVWSLQTGNIVYRLAPVLEDATTGYIISDVRVSPDSSKVFACIEIRSNQTREERLYCWDFASLQKVTPGSTEGNIAEADKVVVVQLDGRDQTPSSPGLHRLAVGNSWACFM